MADDATNGSTVLEDAAAAASSIPDPQPAKDAKAPDDDDELEYEVELKTPFGIVELEFEPLAKRQRKEKERRERAERKAVERAARKAIRDAARADRRRTLLRTFVIALAVTVIIGTAVAIAYWLFARPDEVEGEQVPVDYALTPGAATEPQGVLQRLRARVREAIRQGRRASSEAQKEQVRRIRGMTGR